MTTNIKTIKARMRQNRLVYHLCFPVLFLRRLFNRARRFNNMYDSLFEQVKDGSLVVSMPRYRGDFEIDIRSHILKRVLREKDYEPECSEFVIKHLDPQKDALDIGANIGLYTVLMSSLASGGSRVLAVEPTPGALRYLRQNIARNSCDHAVIVFEGVAANEKGRVSIKTIPGMEEYSSIRKNITHAWLPDKACTAVEVESITVDSLVEKHQLTPGFMKIDTEGAEYLVLSGAERTLTQYRPIILAEVVDQFLSDFGHRSEDVVDLLENSGYRVVNVKMPNVPVKRPFRGEIVALPIQSDGE